MKLDLPEQCSVELVAEMIANRAKGVNAAFFEGIADEWAERVAEFVDAEGNPELIDEWATSLEHKTKFLTLYSTPQEGHAQQIILAGMRADKMHICPSCGEDGVPHTLDHYLPKGKFPHFATIPANLTPMCDICQGHKLEETLDEDDQRIFIHPYFHDFVKKRVLQLEIGEPYDAPRSFTLAPVESLDPDLEALLLRHVKGLELQPRFAHFIKDMHSQLVRTVANIRASELDVVAQIKLFRKMEAARGKNGWRHIFYASVLKDGDLLDWLQHGDLPEHVDSVPDEDDDDI